MSKIRLMEAAAKLNEQWLSLDPWEPVRKEYAKGEVIGSGSFGTVYDASHHDRPVALKSMILENDAEVRMALREIKHLTMVANHRNIVRLLNAYRAEAVSDDMTYRRGILVFERCFFHSAEFLSHSSGSVSWRALKFFALDLFSGLSFLQSKNLMHRDLKPANLLVGNEDERLKLLISDFGSSLQAGLCFFLGHT